MYGLKKQPFHFSTKIVDRTELSIIPETQDCHNYLTLGMEKVRDIWARQKEVSRLFDSDEIPKEHQQILRDIFLEVADLANILTEAKKTLEKTKEINLSTNPSHYMNKQSMLTRDSVFQPRPPTNIHVHIAVVKAQIQLSVLSLLLTNTRPQSTPAANSLVGTYSKVGNKWVQVIDQVDTFTEVDSFQEVVDLICLAYNLCLALRNKITAIDSF